MDGTGPVLTMVIVANISIACHQDTNLRKKAEFKLKKIESISRRKLMRKEANSLPKINQVTYY